MRECERGMDVEDVTMISSREMKFHEQTGESAKLQNCEETSPVP